MEKRLFSRICTAAVAPIMVISIACGLAYAYACARACLVQNDGWMNIPFVSAFAAADCLGIVAGGVGTAGGGVGFVFVGWDRLIRKGLWVGGGCVADDQLRWRC